MIPFPKAALLIETTEGLCPACMRVVEAQILDQDGEVVMMKLCPEHGISRTSLWPNAEHYRWMNAFRLPLQPPKEKASVWGTCPKACGLCADHLRQPTLVEIEVTQRCNLRCPVCFVAAGQAPADPSLAQIEAMYMDILRQAGPQTSVQLTGGEPTVRADLAEILRGGRSLGFAAIEVNTNGLAIAHDPMYVRELAQAGLSGVYLQFDGLSSRAYKQIRGADLLKDKLQAIENCRAAGVQVVLAMTVVWGTNQDQIGKTLAFALENQDVVAGVAFQPAFTSGRFDLVPEKRLSMGDVIFMLSEQSGGLIEPYDLWPLGCSHPLCSSATYIVEQDGVKQPITRLITPQEYIDNFDPDSPQGSVFPDLAARHLPGLGQGLSVVVMNYMDAHTLDLKRLKECSMDVTMENGQLIPFCAYQLTDRRGRRLYPTWGRQELSNG